MRRLLFENSLFKYNFYLYFSLLIFSILNITYGFYIEVSPSSFYGNLFSYIFLAYIIVYYSYFLSILIKFHKNYMFNVITKLFLIINPILFVGINLFINSYYHQITNNEVSNISYFIFIPYVIFTGALSLFLIYKKEKKVNLNSLEYMTFNLNIFNKNIENVSKKETVLYITSVHLSLIFMIIPAFLYISYKFNYDYFVTPNKLHFSALNLSICIISLILFIAFSFIFIFIGIKKKIINYRIIFAYLIIAITSGFYIFGLFTGNGYLINYNNISEADLIYLLSNSLIMVVFSVIIPSLAINTDFIYLKYLYKNNKKQAEKPID